MKIYFDYILTGSMETSKKWTTGESNPWKDQIARVLIASILRHGCIYHRKGKIYRIFSDKTAGR